MSIVKIGENQNYGLKEHNRVTGFLRADNSVLRHFLKRTGVLYLPFGENANTPVSTSNTDIPTATSAVLSFRCAVENGNNAVIINKGQAIDTELRVINNPENFRLPINRSMAHSYLFASHALTAFEVGTCSISATGLVQGTGTKFTETLRPQGDNATLIKFFTGTEPYSQVLINENTGVNNRADYLPISIIDDTTLQLPAGTYTPETGRRYAVVGSFENGIIIPAQDSRRYIYQHDHVEFTFVPGDATSALRNHNSIPLFRVGVLDGSFSSTDSRRFASFLSP